jgi:diamine N-acetyltransferase
VLTLQGDHINLRALELSDLSVLESTENDESLWHLSQSIVPFSRHQLEVFILSASSDLYATKQLRLAISNKQGEALGFIDLFDFDPISKKAGVGIVLAKREHRGKGYGKEALTLLIAYAFGRLGLHQLYCNVLESNTASLNLFEQLGFKKVGLKKDWSYWEGHYENEWLLQLINTEHVH